MGHDDRKYDSVVLYKNQKGILDRKVDREITAIKENPRRYPLRQSNELILEKRLRQLPTNPSTCGIQSANNRVVYRRANHFSIFLTSWDATRSKNGK